MTEKKMLDILKGLIKIAEEGIKKVDLDIAQDVYPYTIERFFYSNVLTNFKNNLNDENIKEYGMDKGDVEKIKKEFKEDFQKCEDILSEKEYNKEREDEDYEEEDDEEEEEEINVLGYTEEDMFNMSERELEKLREEYDRRCEEEDKRLEEKERADFKFYQNFRTKIKNISPSIYKLLEEIEKLMEFNDCEKLIKDFKDRVKESPNRTTMNVNFLKPDLTEDEEDEEKVVPFIEVKEEKAKKKSFGGS